MAAIQAHDNQIAGSGITTVFDAIRGKIRDEGFVRNKAVYIALGILPDGTKDILGIWIEQTEGAKVWLKLRAEGHTAWRSDTSHDLEENL